MIPVEKFLQCVQENAERIHAYELRHNGSDGKSDCIGLIIGALTLAGFRWPGTHGSNWAARNAMATLGYISEDSELFPGEVVYKAREPGEEKYDLPSTYKNSPDQRDYYHVGVVTSVSPLVITHCTGVEGGIKRDNMQGEWRYGGKLKYVHYSEDTDMVEEPLYNAIVTASNGLPVNVRSGPNISYEVIKRLDVGTKVDIIEELDGWRKIRHESTEGYMMSKFLKKAVDTDLQDILAHFESAVAELKAYMEAHE